MKKIFLSIALPLLASAPILAQAPLSAYHTEHFTFRHELNPAFQPDTNYISLPLLGNLSVGMQSTMSLSDLIYDRSDGKLTTFMSPGTITKSDLMDKVGDSWKTNEYATINIVSLGRRVNPKRFQTIGLAFRMNADTQIGKGMFDMLKNIENRQYQVNDINISASAWLELAAGESRRLNDQWTVGAKAKLLVGMYNVSAKADGYVLDLSSDNQWTVQGTAELNASGLAFKEEMKNYKNRTGMYKQVSGFSNKLGIHGIGLAVDLGAEYKLDDHWTFSASVLDLGFIDWFGNNKAKNKNQYFKFNGFQNATIDNDDANSLKSQWNRLSDDFMDFLHLENQGKENLFQTLSGTLHIGASYRTGIFTAGALFTGQTHYGYLSAEGRLNLGAQPIRDLDITLSPAYGTFGFQLGGMISYHPGRYQFYLASNRMFLKANKQFIPTTLDGDFQLGVAFPL